MAVFTAFVTSPRPSMPYSPDDGQTWQYTAQVDIVVINSANQPVAPWGMVEPWTGYLTLDSAQPLTTSDTLASIRTKALANLRGAYAPAITSTDTIRVVWLDNGGLLSL